MAGTEDATAGTVPGPVRARSVGPEEAGASAEAPADVAGRAVWLARELGWEQLVDQARALGPDPALHALSDDDLDQRLRCQASELAAATCRWLELLAELVVRGLWADQGLTTPAQWLAWRIGLAPSTARDHVRVALQLRRLPLIRERFREGRISYSKVRALTRVAVPEIEPMLLEWSDHATAAEIERIVRGFRQVQRGKTATPEDRERGRGVHERELDGGLIELRIRLRPEEALEARALLERLADLEVDAADAAAAATRAGDSHDLQPELPEAASSDPASSDPAAVAAVGLGDGAQLTGSPAASGHHRGGVMVDALLAALTAAVADGPPDTSGADRHTLVLHADAEDLVDSPAAAEVIPIDERSGRCRAMDRNVLRRIACESGIVVVARDRHGTPMDIGRRDRRLTAALRRAVLVRDRSCRFPGCGATRHLHAHHIEHWADGGRTDLVNLVALCSTHHRFVHEHGWHIEVTGTGGFAFSPPGAAPVPSVAVLPDHRTADPDDRVDVPPAERPDRLQPIEWHGPDGVDLDLTVAVLDQELRRVLPARITDAA